MKITDLSAAEQARVTDIYAMLNRRAAVNTAPPAGYAATCPRCGQPSNATIVKAWGHCIACKHG
jgi:hypothetical protein